MTAPKEKPGTERYRDERRSGGPRMHGRKWHDHEQPHQVDRLTGGGHPSGSRGGPSMEAAEERVGLGKHIGRKDKGSSRVNERASRGKGISRNKGTARARSAQKR